MGEGRRCPQEGVGGGSLPLAMSKVSTLSWALAAQFGTGVTGVRSVRCPLCDVPMREVSRRGVLIDVCPECRGVWLDRGELNKLLETADHWEESHLPRGEPPAPEPRHGWPEKSHPHRHKSFWHELFDFELFD